MRVEKEHTGHQVYIDGKLQVEKGQIKETAAMLRNRKLKEQRARDKELGANPSPTSSVHGSLSSAAIKKANHVLEKHSALGLRCDIEIGFGVYFARHSA